MRCIYENTFLNDFLNDYLSQTDAVPSSTLPDEGFGDYADKTTQ